MLTAFSQPELIQRAVAAGAMGYLVKPFKPEELRAALPWRWQRVQPVARRARAAPGTSSRAWPTARLIERARGVVQQRLGISEDEAYTWLRRAAMDQRLPLAEVARKILIAPENATAITDLQHVGGGRLSVGACP